MTPFENACKTPFQHEKNHSFSRSAWTTLLRVPLQKAFHHISHLSAFHNCRFHLQILEFLSRVSRGLSKLGTARQGNKFVSTRWSEINSRKIPTQKNHIGVLQVEWRILVWFEVWTALVEIIFSEAYYFRHGSHNKRTKKGRSLQICIQWWNLTLRKLWANCRTQTVLSFWKRPKEGQFIVCKSPPTQREEKFCADFAAVYLSLRDCGMINLVTGATLTSESVCSPAAVRLISNTVSLILSQRHSALHQHFKQIVHRPTVESLLITSNDSFWKQTGCNTNSLKWPDPGSLLNELIVWLVQLQIAGCVAKANVQNISRRFGTYAVIILGLKATRKDQYWLLTNTICVSTFLR